MSWNPNMVLKGKLSQLLIQYPVRTQAYLRSRLSLEILNEYVVWYPEQPAVVLQQRAGNTKSVFIQENTFYFPSSVPTIG